MSKNKKEDIEKLVTDFINMQLEYVKFTEYMERKVQNILIENNIKYQAITSRVKDIESLRKKLNFMGKNNFSQIVNDVRKINDLSGIRIIVYNREQQKEVEDILSPYFKIEHYSPEREKYDAVNITIALKEKNISKFKNMKCEIQIVLVLSHALMEFGHDIFYKDRDELKKKDKEGYEQLEKLYNESFEKIIQIETAMNEIKVRSENIKNGRLIINTIIDNKYITEIENANNYNEINKIIEDFNTAVIMLNKDNESANIIARNKLILRLLKSYVKIPSENYENNNFYFNTRDFVFDKILEIIQKYIYLCLDDFKEIMDILVKYGEENDKKEKIIKTIKNIIQMDKHYNCFRLYSSIYKWIINNTEEELEYKSEIAIEYCNLNVSYAEESGYLEYKLCDKVLNPNEQYKENIKELINRFCKICLKKSDMNLFKKVKSMCETDYRTKDKTDDFKLKILIDFFTSNYDTADIYMLHEVYKMGIFYEKDEFYKTQFYNKIKKDNCCKLYSYLFSFFLDDIPSKKHEIVENERKSFLDDYLKNINTAKEKEIIEICKLMDKYEDELYNNYEACDFLYKIGKTYNNAIQLYEITENKYLLFGIYNSSDYKYEVKNILEKKKILKYLDINKEIMPLRLLDQLISTTQIGKDEAIDNWFCRIILKDINLLKEKPYLDFVMNIIEFYNKKNITILNGCGYYFNDNKEFISILKKQKLEKVLSNVSYKNIEIGEEFLLKDTFEIFPDIVRKFICKHIENYNKKDYRMDTISLDECKNFDDELENNVQCALKLLKKHEYYQISYEIRFLVGKYNKNLSECLAKKIKSKENIKGVIDILKVLDVSINAWDIFGKIIELEPDKNIESDIDCMLFSSSGEGEYGLANTFKDKFEFFRELEKDKTINNENVLRFAKEEKEKFYSIYNSEYAKTKRRIIENKEKYKIRNKK